MRRLVSIVVATIALLAVAIPANAAHHAENCGTITRGNGMQYGWCLLVNTQDVPTAGANTEGLFKYEPGPCDGMSVYIEVVNLWHDPQNDGSFAIARQTVFDRWFDVPQCGIYTSTSVSTAWFDNCLNPSMPNSYKAEAVFKVKWSDGVVGGEQDHWSNVYSNGIC